VGIILYRMLTGQLPFTGVDLGDVLVRVCTDVFARPSAIAPDLPAGLDEFFERALARLPVQRFQSAMDLTAAFESARAREPLTASSHAVGRNGTIAMPPLASALTVGVVEGPRDSAPTEEWKPALVEKATGAAPQATTAPEPAATVAPDVNPASISAVLVMGRRPGSSPAITPPVARNTIAHGRALIALSAIAGVLALAGIVGPTLLRHTGTQPLPAEPLVAAAAPPPRVDAARVVEPMSPGPPALEPSQSALPAASLAPSAAARPPKPPSLRKDPIHVPTTPAVAPILPPQQPQPKSDAPAVKPVVVLDPAARED
jgi:serine/threonine-protein kinase